VLKIVTNGTLKQTIAVVDAGAISELTKMVRLKSYHEDGQTWTMEMREIELMRQIICKHAVVALGNIAGKSDELRDKVISLGGLDSLLKWMNNGEYLHFTTLKRCAYTLSNFCKSEKTPLEKTQVEAILPTLNALASHFHPGVSVPILFMFFQ